MLYLVAFFVGVILGGGSLFAILIERQSRLRSEKSKLQEEAKKIKEAREAANRRHQELEREASRLKGAQQKLDARIISYTELQDETRFSNATFKTLMSTFESSS